MGGGNLTAVFCDTGWEHPDTYKHVNDVCLQMGVRLITLKSKYDFVSLAVHKKRFPSTNARFCTSELKMKPMIDYVLSLKESCIIIQGIRAGESTARAAMEEECMYFKSYFQPNKKGRTENYRSKDVKEWCSQFDASVLRPIFKWSAQQVIDCILDAGQKPNPLYYRGFSRVGCFPCIMCRHKEIELIAKNRTEMSETKIILDACCGSRMFWFDKENPLALFADIRDEEYILCDGRNLKVHPDIVSDFTDMPFLDKSFKLVVFDPPHLLKVGKNSWLAKKYGKLPEDWPRVIKKGIDECFRVLDDYGVLIFKWNEDQITVREVLSAINRQPLFGHTTGRHGKTMWMCFMKLPIN